MRFNKTTNLSISVYNNKSEGFLTTFDYSTDCDLKDALLEAVNAYYEDLEGNTGDVYKPLGKLDEEVFTYEVDDWGDVEDYDNLQDVELLQEIADESIDASWEVISAAVELGINLFNINDSYVGEYNSDEDFARETAEQTEGTMIKNWPYNCIDWEQAAKELMYDYSEANGHYFRM